MAIISIIILTIMAIFRPRHHRHGHRIIGVMSLTPYLIYATTAQSGNARRAKDAMMTVVVAWMIIMIITFITHHHHHHGQHHHDPSSLLS